MATFNTFRPSAQQLADLQKMNKARSQGNYLLGGNIGASAGTNPQLSQYKAGIATPPTSGVLGAQAPSGGGQSSGGGQPTPGGNQSNFSVNDVLQQQPEFQLPDFDAMIAPALQGLEAAIAPEQEKFATAEKTLGEQKATALTKAKQEFGAQESEIGRAKTEQTQRTESAVDEARRQFGELQQGIQSRYGGTTGTGRFAAEIAGGQTLRNIANARQALSGAIGQLDDKLFQVKEIGRIAQAEIEDKTNSLIRDARSQLDTALADIRRQKGEIQSRKAELASNAIQWYQGEVNRVKQQNAQFLQGLFNQQQAAEQQLQLAMQKAKSTTSNLGTVDYSQYVGENNPLIQAGFTPTVTQKAPGGVSVSYSQGKEDSFEEKLRKAAQALGGQQ